MKRFIINIAIFSVLVLVLYAVGYNVFYKFTTPGGKNVVYVWGDSQTCENLDLGYINSNSPYHLYSAALHGASVYNFQVFSRSVPPNSDVIVQISEPALLRRKEVDMNNSAIDIEALNQLRQNNYTYSSLFSVLRRNLRPNKMFKDETSLNETYDTITLAEPLSLFSSVYATKPAYFNDKKSLYLDGINTLLQKHCRIIGLVFPFHPILDSIKSKSPYVADLSHFENEVASLFPRKQTIPINTTQNIFYDLTHMNRRGAHSLSAQLVTALIFTNEPMLIEVKKL